MKILLTAKQRGSTNVLAPVARELSQRGNDITIYATGNEIEAAGFEGLIYKHINPTDDDFLRLVKSHDAVVVGLSGYNTPDGSFLRAANSIHIPTVAVLEHNSDYIGKLGNNISDLPSLIAVMDESCLDEAEKQLGEQIGSEVTKRMQVVGWTAFDHYAVLRDNHNSQKRLLLLCKLGINPDNSIYSHFTHNIHPDSEYQKKASGSSENHQKKYDYEISVTKAVFQAASDLNIKLAVKPHPGEKFTTNFTKELTTHHGHLYIPPEACNTQQLILSSYSVTASRSASLTEATLLDRNAGSLIPDLDNDCIKAYPPLSLKAIPYTQKWEEIKRIIELVTSTDETIINKLAEDRKKFSVDGKASKRLVDLIEKLC